MIKLTDLQLSTLALAVFDADGPDARDRVYDILARAEKYQPYKAHVVTDAMVKAAAMAVVQDIVWGNGAPLTAEACWDNAPANLREKQLRQSRAAIEAALEASLVPQGTMRCPVCGWDEPHDANGHRFFDDLADQVDFVQSQIRRGHWNDLDESTTLAEVSAALREAALAQQAQPEMPTREQIARAIFFSDEGYEPEFESTTYLNNADAVLALFAKETP